MAQIKIEFSELVASNSFRKIARLPDGEERLQLSSRRIQGFGPDLINQRGANKTLIRGGCRQIGSTRTDDLPRHPTAHPLAAWDKGR